MACPFCDLGICADSSHRESVLLFDVNRSGGGRPSPSKAPEPDYAELDRRIRDAKNGPFPTQEEEEGLIASRLGVPIGVRNAHAIPKIIHRFWSGGAMRDGALANLRDCMHQVNGLGWKCILWYSSTLEALLDKEKIGKDARQMRALQRQALAHVGYDVRAIEELASSKSIFRSHDVTKELLALFATWAADSVMEGSWDGVKYFSDFARLFYLHELGGFHIDVDMGLGDMDLRATYFHNDPRGEVPLLGTLARDSTNKRIAKRFRYLKVCRKKRAVDPARYKECLEVLVDEAETGAVMYNGLIATRPKTRHCNVALVTYRDKLLEGKMLDTGMSVQCILLCGDATTRGQKLALAMKLSVPPYVLRLDQLTEESDAGAGVKKK
ncbi:MAG TPA: hypothetical protein VK447_09545 [Myxococcaceae bacterium]|nr:hypothetical protein [Myxococcaceae bacterium]